MAHAEDEPAHLDEGLEDDGGLGSGLISGWSRIMTDRDLGDGDAATVESDEKLGGEEGSSRLDFDSVEDATIEQLECAVHVSDSEPEDESL